MAKDATPSAVRRGRTSRPRRSARKAGGSSEARHRLAREGPGRQPVRPDPSVDGNHDDSANGNRDEKIAIELTRAQIDEVVRAAGEGGTMSLLLSALRAPDWTFTLKVGGETYDQLEDRRLSRSLLSGLLVLSCFPPDGVYLGIVDISRMLSMNMSTTHRYVSTLMVAGLLERDPDLRKYRIARTR